MKLDEWVDVLHRKYQGGEDGATRTLEYISFQIDKKDYLKQKHLDAFETFLEDQWDPESDPDAEITSHYINTHPMMKYIGPIPDYGTWTTGAQGSVKLATVQPLTYWHGHLGKLGGIVGTSTPAKSEVEAISNIEKELSGLAEDQEAQRLALLAELEERFEKLNANIKAYTDSAIGDAPADNRAQEDLEHFFPDDRGAMDKVQSKLREPEFYAQEAEALQIDAENIIPIWLTPYANLEPIVESEDLDHEQRVRKTYDLLGLHTAEGKPRLCAVLVFDVPIQNIAAACRKPTCFSDGYKESYASYKCANNLGRTVKHTDGCVGGEEALIPLSVLHTCQFEIKLLGYLPEDWFPQDEKPDSYFEEVEKRVA